MGEARFQILESQLPANVSVLGLDEHTACIIDLAKAEGAVRGIGRVVYRKAGRELVFRKGDRFPLSVLTGREEIGQEWQPTEREPAAVDQTASEPEEAFWEAIHRIEADFNRALGQEDPDRATDALLNLDQAIWKALQDLESDEVISQAREIFREFVVLFGTTLIPSLDRHKERFESLMSGLLPLREEFRSQKQWSEADKIRDALKDAGISVEDTENGPEWKIPT